MFVIDNDLTIHITRGDTALIAVTATIGGTYFEFKPDDVVRLKVFAKKDCDDVVLKKDTVVTAATEAVEITLTGEDTKIGEIINKPVDYWYEVELNPETNPQTIVGYDENGAKVFKLYPEGGVINE
jgi:hypothetical protein